ncbi:9034_t:CDS:2, partial [Ambispora gerdemannii]
TPCRHIITVYLQYLRICVLPNEIHKRWQLPKCHHDNFLDLMKHTSEYVLEIGKVLKLLQ